MPHHHVGNWRPITKRIRARRTLTTGVRELRDNLTAALRVLEEGECRIVVLRRSEMTGALVPMPDYSFLVEIDEALRRRGFRRGPDITAEDIVDAIMAIRPGKKRLGPVPSLVLPKPLTLREALGPPEMQEVTAWIQAEARARRAGGR